MSEFKFRTSPDIHITAIVSPQVPQAVNMI